MAELTTGSHIAGFRIEAVAGRGGMGVVYRATQLGLDRQVALKVIIPELADDVLFRERFERESLTAASIDHPNVIPVYEAGTAEGQLFIAMRYVEGTDLRLLIQRNGQLDSERAVRVVEQVGAALDAAHRRGLVHRDVKPANVLITDDPDEHVYLTDFGLTKHAASIGGPTQTGQFMGTPDYTAPEQIKGERADARTDVYALGCVLFQAISGHVPFERDTEVAKIYAHLTDPPPSIGMNVPELGKRLDHVIGRALAKDPDERYQSAGDLGRAARAALADSGPVPERTVATGLAAPTVASPGEQRITPSPGEARTAPSPGEARTAPSPGEARTAPSPAEPSTAAGPTAASPSGDPTAASPPDSPPPAERPTPAVPPPPPPPPGSAPAAPSRRRPLPFVLAGIVLAAAAVGGLAVAGVVGGGDEKEQPDGQQTQTEPPPSQPEVTASIKVGPGPDAITVSEGIVWVTLAQNASVTPIDAATNKARETIPVGNNPDGVAGDGDTIWTVLTDDDAVRRVENVGEAPLAGAKVAVGDRPEGLSLGAQLVWVANSGSDSVSRIDRASATEVGAPIGVGDLPTGIFVGEESVWVTNNGDASVTRLGTANSEVLDDSIPVGEKPRGVVEGGGSVWVANAGDGTVTRLDASTGEPIGKPIQVGDNSRDIAFGEGFVWVTSRGDNTVTRIDPETGRVVGRPIPVGTAPLGVAVGAGAVWVANFEDDTVSRIDP